MELLALLNLLFQIFFRLSQFSLLVLQLSVSQRLLLGVCLAGRLQSGELQSKVVREQLSVLLVFLFNKLIGEAVRLLNLLGLSRNFQV